MAQSERTWPDLGYHAVAALASAHVCDFKAYKTVAFFDIDGNVAEVQFEEAGSACNAPTTDIARAQVYLHGHVKWDGCSDWHFDEQDGAMLHFCGREAAGNLGALLQRLYDWAAELIPAWDKKGNA